MAATIWHSGQPAARGDRLVGSASSSGPRLLMLVPVLFVLATFGMATAVFVWSSFTESRSAADGMLTLGNYRRVLGDPYNWVVLWGTTRISLIVVVLTAIISYPLALVIARNNAWWAQLFMGVVLASSTMSLVIRALGWIGLLDTKGVLNSVLIATGMIDKPLRLLGTQAGVIVGLVHGFVPLLTLTLVPILQSIDPMLEVAAAGLGARRWEQLWRITLPLSLPGLVSGSFLVFAMSMGAYTTPALLGGGRAIVFPELIQQQVHLLLDYPTGAVLSLMLLVFVLVAVSLAATLTRTKVQGVGA
jgi:putative spermidine/putrescine transport system permease protein